MVKRYLLDLYSSAMFDGKGKFVATSKARNDVTTILEREGVIRIPLERTFDNKILGVLQVLVKIIWNIFFKIDKKSILYVQYPIINLRPFSYIAPLFKRYKSILIIHDVRSYCFPELIPLRKKEISIINCFDSVIAHTEAMKEQLVRDGVKSKIVVLGAFDYLLTPQMAVKEDDGGIVFAGNLQKSGFLKDLHLLSGLKFNLYGGQKPEITYNDKIVYQGKFLPDDISPIVGGWGLLWEGDSIDTCSGFHGEYLELIAPHKFSLYIASGLKIICWEKSAMAKLVVDRNLGFTIKSLSELPQKLSSFTESQLNEMKNKVLCFQQQIRNGCMLKNACFSI